MDGRGHLTRDGGQESPDRTPPGDGAGTVELEQPRRSDVPPGPRGRRLKMWPGYKRPSGVGAGVVVSTCTVSAKNAQLEAASCSLSRDRHISCRYNAQPDIRVQLSNNGRRRHVPSWWLRVPARSRWVRWGWGGAAGGLGERLTPPRMATGRHELQRRSRPTGVGDDLAGEH